MLKLAQDIKAKRAAGELTDYLKNQTMIMLFEKTSTRTRCAFEVAAYDQGANVTYLGPTGTQIGVKESMKDTARVLARMYDGIEYRGIDQETLEELGRHGYSLGPGVLYPTLHRLRKEGYLQQNSEVVNGKVRKYYTITDEGNAVLDEAIPKIKELVNEVLEEQG